MSHVDFETEPLPGLPALPPDGEQILWQGSPRWQTVARRILHIDVLAIYFVLLLAWRIERGVNGGASAEQIATTAAWCVGFAALALGVLTWIARAIGRTTIYTITSNRVAWRQRNRRRGAPANTGAVCIECSAEPALEPFVFPPEASRLGAVRGWRPLAVDRRAHADDGGA